MRHTVEHAPQNVMTEPGEIAASHDRCSDLMRRWEMWLDAEQAAAVRAAREP
jgi:hypothetical protein